MQPPDSETAKTAFAGKVLWDSLHRDVEVRSVVDMSVEVEVNRVHAVLRFVQDSHAFCNAYLRVFLPVSDAEGVDIQYIRYDNGSVTLAVQKRPAAVPACNLFAIRTAYPKIGIQP